ncbi:MAG: AAA family ATPase [Chloroflexota bacterium]|nr:AAA family ATPase [Chloroflexota bacterium]
MSSFISTITPTLPHDQEPIETSSVEEFFGFLQLVLKAADGLRPVIAIAYSDRAGIGKSTAILAAAESVIPASHTGRPNVLLLELEPDIAPIAFLELILDVLEERARGRTKSRLRKSVIEALKRNDIRLIVFDEADQFSRRTFEELRYICGKTGCPMLLVGLKRILSVVKPFEQLDSRSFRTHEIKPLEEAEVLQIVFPQLRYARWSFDPDNRDHMKLGREIWRRVRPSLRLACGVIETASDIAEITGAERITTEHVTEALKHIRTKGLRHRVQSNPDADARRGPHEALSEERQRAKEKDSGDDE